jgi:Ser/Thr protein kinase RdoA (MazF antagonist)
MTAFRTKDSVQIRRLRAIRAARAVADSVGIDVREPKVLKDSNNTIVHLAPSDIVAKVATSHFRDAKLESLERELAVAMYLIERGAPVASPARDAPPGPHHHGDQILTLWQYVEADPMRRVDPHALAATLKVVHEEIADYPAHLPSFTVELDDARDLLALGRSPLLSPDDRRYLLDVLDEVETVLSTLVLERRPLHGSPHEGNWVAAAGGPVLLDFETACRGPVEWDLAALDDEVVGQFSSVDEELIALLRRMRSACVAAKCWVDPGRAPEVNEAAQVHLRLLRGEPLDSVIG